MLRTSMRFLCAANSHRYHGEWSESHDPNKQYDYMTLQLACTLFGYKLSDRFEKKDLKARFNKLALKYHPDHGGTEKEFQTLIEAHKLLQSHRHDKGGNRFNFHRAKPKNVKEETSRPTKEKPFGEVTDDNKTYDSYDIAIFIVVFTGIVMYYIRHARYIQNELQTKRARLTEDDMDDETKLMSKEHDWHPWRATQNEKDEMAKIAVIQGSISEEVAREKAALRGELPKSPFTL
eukprot:Tbor_TRINITY_DN2842_c0_g1::TRINITY_DN2842_c0_g1_i1::g.23153::m.23153